MKKVILLFALLVCAGQTLSAQNKSAAPTTVSLNVTGGYTFRDDVTFTNAYGYIKEGAQYGLGLEYFVHPNYSIGINYTRMDTRAPLFSYSGFNNQLNEGTDAININYIMLNGLRYLTLRSPIIKPYAGIGAGIAIVNSKDGGSSSTEFAWDAKLGIKLKTSSALGFKVQAQLQSIVQGIGGGLYVGTGGAGVGVSTYSSVYQFGFTGAVTLDI